jgi:hypothetical protein
VDDAASREEKPPITFPDLTPGAFEITTLVKDEHISSKKTNNNMLL